MGASLTSDFGVGSSANLKLFLPTSPPANEPRGDESPSGVLARPGDSLFALAKRHGASFEEIQRLNPEYARTLPVGAWVKLSPASPGNVNGEAGRGKGEGLSYVGLTRSAAREQAILEKSGFEVRRHGGASAASNELRREYQKVDLNRSEGVASFAQAIVKDPKKQEVVERVLNAADRSVRDELASWAEMLADGEARPAAMPTRAVFSGHSITGAFYGEKGEEGAEAFLTRSAIADLNSAFPSAAKKVEHVLFSGCRTVLDKGDAKEVAAMFPGAKTITGYRGKSPNADTGSLNHLKQWERATRGSALAEGLEQMLKGTNHHDSLVVWRRYSNGEETFSGGDLNLKALRDSAVTYRSLVEQSQRTGTQLLARELREFQSVLEVLARKCPRSERAAYVQEANGVKALLEKTVVSARAYSPVLPS